MPVTLGFLRVRVFAASQSHDECTLRDALFFVLTTGLTSTPIRFNRRTIRLRYSTLKVYKKSDINRCVVPNKLLLRFE
jgi:hypothetical protein